MRCKVAIGVIAAIVMFAPRADVDFVNIQRCVQPIPRRALLIPRRIVPRKNIVTRDARRGTGTQLKRGAVRITLNHYLAGAEIAYLELIEFTWREVRDE